MSEIHTKSIFLLQTFAILFAKTVVVQIFFVSFPYNLSAI